VLPFEMRSLGDDYVKSEFRRHRDVMNPVYVMGFLTQWKMYLDQLPAGPDARAYSGKKLDPTIFEKVNDVARAARTVVRGDARYQRCLETRGTGGRGTRYTGSRVGETIDPAG